METKSFKTDFTVEGEAAKLTKKDLETYAQGLGIKFPGRLRKAEVAAAYASYILDHAGDILAHSSEWEVTLFRDLVQAGPGKGVAVKHFPPAFTIPLFLLLRIVTEDETDLCWFVMPDELRNAVGSKAGELLTDPDFLQRAKYLQSQRGLATLYGIAPLGHLVDEIKRVYPELNDMDRLLDVMLCPEVMSFSHLDFDGENGDMSLAISPYVYHAFARPYDLLPQIRADQDFKEFTGQQIMDAGKFPYPHFGGAAADKLRKLLVSGGLSPADAEELMYDLWLDKQDFDASPVRFMDRIPDTLTFSSMEDLNVLVQAVTAYTNEVPCWALLGHSSREVGSKKAMTRPPRIVVGPNLRKAGYRDADIQPLADAAFFADVADSMLYKAGRNDPCPCGSGKKFKNCHGKGN